jgi:hypothetical protein
LCIRVEFIWASFWRGIVETASNGEQKEKTKNAVSIKKESADFGMSAAAAEGMLVGGGAVPDDDEEIVDEEVDEDEEEMDDEMEEDEDEEDEDDMQG